MKKDLRKGSQEYEIVAWNKVKTSDTVKTFYDKNSAACFLRGFMCDRFSMMAMRNALSDTGTSCRDTSRLSDNDVIEQLAWMLVPGHIKIIISLACSALCKRAPLTLL